MLFLLSPAKSLDTESPVPTPVAPWATEPLFVAQAERLVRVLRRQSVKQVAELMDLSPALAELNTERYARWSAQATEANSKPAVLMFNGDVYDGLQAPSLSPDDLQWAQQHLVILSGLYGALRPLDRLQPYRLEMGTALPTPRGRNLYAYWGDTVAQYLNERAQAQATPVIVNLASQEYFKVADRPVLRPRVIECVFEDFKNDRYKVISFFAKKARGLMARFAITQRLTLPEQLLGFQAEGYAHAPEASGPDRWVFRRRL